ncbi:MAG: M15 family metallopeptidase [Elusimicrobia bacterium]|nr:M15 family metallopeptidase [Elusimicrobiota bacterium]
MKSCLIWFLLALSACASGRRAAEPLVDFEQLHTEAVLDIRYATENNFTHQVVYPVAKCALRQSVADDLAAAARDFEAKGYRLKIYDCYRPLSVQKIFWTLVPDERYVADPKKGSRHNRGAAVDVSLTDKEGLELEMPSSYDDFSERAHRDWDKATPEAKKNKELLERVMGKHGFVGLDTEWWHFDARGWTAYPLEDAPLETVR